MSGRTAVVIVAAGSGSRLGGEVPKQYRSLAGVALLQRTVTACLASERVDLLVCVIGSDQRELYERSVKSADRLLPPVVGGGSRQASVLAGLRSLLGHEIETVLVHDAARPFVTADLIERVVDAARTRGGALPAVPVADTLVRASGGTMGANVSREGLWHAQTPQGFSYEALLAAHEAASDEHTDDAGLARSAGLAVEIVRGDPSNGKITTPEDFAMAERALSLPDVRVGHGYDTHRLVPGDHVMLCGVRVDHDAGLDGHSDADVGLHALTDALLATIGAGDIGDHFPPSDPQWRGASSDLFLEHAVSLVETAGGRIRHGDVTIVCEAPKIGPHRRAMRERMAALLGVEPARVSVKATTNEERGFVGRNEGIVALATATVVFG